MATEQEGNLATEQEINHHEISLTSGINDYFPDVGGATLGLYQENTSTATSKQLLFSAPLLSNLGKGGVGGGGGGVLYYGSSHIIIIVSAW